MAGEEDCSGGGIFLTEYIMINILLRLPIASCIARFRCVCRSWRILLSDPQFISKILIFDSDHQNKSSSSSSLQLLIATVGEASTPVYLRRGDYSLLSCHTLRPISSSWEDLPSTGHSIRYLVIAGSCDGIFCLVEKNWSPTGGAPDVILWNPATSETKFLPLTTRPPPPHPRPIFPHQLIIGFGFDPQTNDYKVARIMCYNEWGKDSDHYDFENSGAFAEVYSLRSKSWKSITINDDVQIPDFSCFAHYLAVQQQQQRGRSSSRSCFWFYAGLEVWFTLSFDMTEEVFKSTSIALPPPLRRHADASGSFAVSGCFMLKDSLHTIFYHIDNGTTYYSVWCLLKQSVADSWTKLYTFTTPPGYCNIQFLQVWKEDTYICVMDELIVCKGGGDYDYKVKNGVFIFSVAMGNIVDRIEIQARRRPFQAHIFTPTRVSLSHFLEEQ